MGLKLGVSMFWILCHLILMSSAGERELPKCKKIMKADYHLPERCRNQGVGTFDVCKYEEYEPRYHGKSCCFKLDDRDGEHLDYYKSFRFFIYDREHQSPPYYPQNTLRYLDSTLAQEGRSFCLVGEHFYQTQLIHWKNFKMFQPLTDRFFDIGNHIHPLDSRLMNTFVPFNTAILFGKRKNGFRNVLTTPNVKADFKQVYCGTRTHPQGVDPAVYGSGWNYCGSNNKEFPYDTLNDVNPNKHLHRPAIPEEAMDPICRNPYKVKVTRIEVDELQMKNYLHIKVYSDATSNPPSGGKCPTGKMKYLMLEVRDQDGFPVGQFTNEIPCDTEHNKETPSCPPSTRPCAPLYGSKKNFMPCMFSHHLASEAPMIFLAGVESSSVPPGGNSSGGGGPGPIGGGPDGGGGASYITEVHTTWKFAQMSSHLITELHFATMIVEDVTPIRYYTSRITEWDGIYECGDAALKYGSGDGIYKCCSLQENYGIWTCASIVAGWKSTQQGSYYDKYLYNENHKPDYAPMRANKYYHCGLSQFCSLNYHVNGTNNTDRPYGFSAQYNVIKLKKGSLGGWDYFRKSFIRDRDINCHKDIPEIDPYFELVSSYPHGNPYAQLPPRRKMFLDERYRDIDGGKGELEDILTPGRHAHSTLNSNLDCTKGKYRKHWGYIGKSPEDLMKKALKDVWNDPVVVQTYYAVDPKITEYFGTKYTKQGDPSTSPIPPEFKRELTRSLEEMVKQDNIRCPCPFVPTTEAPEIQTKAPVEIHARHVHVVNMLIAWVVLVPLAYFVARYYKETLSKVFFLQEFWWYTIHVLALLTALLFMVGSFYAMHLRREGSDYKILWTDATRIHIWFGYSLVTVFVIHLLLGAFRFWDVDIRYIQIWLHWGVGWAEYFLAGVTIISAAGIPQGLMNCMSVYIYAGFIAFQILFYVVMETHIRSVDNNRLNLSPPRQYFPVPMMRIFHKDAPGALFRIWMLIAYFLISIGFYAALHFATSLTPVSCFQKK
ncbi:unnamed protein product [Orchesella dallaii]|uniref:ascorbate ferrireductase (transmembrane) n=1 Tax=Orchesella dallaii TaxID=48710 RepID=A0ABP1RQ20_9HEXA